MTPYGDELAEIIRSTAIEDGIACRFIVEGTPVPQGSLRAFMAGGRPNLVYSNREPLALWRDAIRDACPWTDPQPGPFVITLTFRTRRPRGHYGAHGILPRYLDAQPVSRPDLDKLARAAIDALTGRAYLDDAQIVEIHALKRYGSSSGLEVELWRA